MGKCTKTGCAFVYTTEKRKKAGTIGILRQKDLHLQNQNPSKMKKIIVAISLIFILGLIASSCMSTGKMGCPTNTASNKPFRA